MPIPLEKVVITLAEYKRLENIKTLQSYGHEFRIGLDCPGWTLYYDQNEDRKWVYYEFNNKHKVYHKWASHEELIHL